MHRTQYHRCKAYARLWADAQAAAYRRPVSTMMVTRWVDRCHRADLDGGAPSGWRGPLVIDLTKEPADAAADVDYDDVPRAEFMCHLIFGLMILTAAFERTSVSGKCGRALHYS